MRTITGSMTLLVMLWATWAAAQGTPSTPGTAEPGSAAADSAAPGSAAADGTAPAVDAPAVAAPDSAAPPSQRSPAPADIRVLPLPGRELPRPPVRVHNPTHSMEVRIEEVRRDTVFVPVIAELRAQRLDDARRSLEAIRDRARDVLQRQVAAYDRIEVDFFDGDFTTAREAYQAFARTHKRGYLTNDAIARIFLIDENSDQMQFPLRFLARSELYARIGEVDSAIAVCEVALDRFTGSALIDDLHLQVGDLFLRSETPAAALPHYRAVADSMPETPLAARALMRIGNYHDAIERDVPAAIEAYEDVLERFPDSLEAPEARKILEGLHRRT